MDTADLTRLLDTKLSDLMLEAQEDSRIEEEDIARASEKLLEFMLEERISPGTLLRAFPIVCIEISNRVEKMKGKKDA